MNALACPICKALYGQCEHTAGPKHAKRCPRLRLPPGTCTCGADAAWFGPGGGREKLQATEDAARRVYESLAPQTIFNTSSPDVPWYAKQADRDASPGDDMTAIELTQTEREIVAEAATNGMTVSFTPAPLCDAIHPVHGPCSGPKSHGRLNFKDGPCDHITHVGQHGSRALRWDDPHICRNWTGRKCPSCDGTGEGEQRYNSCGPVPCGDCGGTGNEFGKVEPPECRDEYCPVRVLEERGLPQEESQ